MQVLVLTGIIVAATVAAVFIVGVAWSYWQNLNLGEGND